MELFGQTDIGLRYQENQDSYWGATLEVDSKPAAILILCDGMGGLADGKKASQQVVKSIKGLVQKGTLSQHSIIDTLKKANDSILESSKLNGTRSGTTCSLVFLMNNKYFGIHIGDSRIYHYSGGKQNLLTNDHTALEVRRKRGEKITPEIERKYRSTLSRCIGVRPNPRFDFIDGTYKEGDTFLVCSDGFWHYWKGSFADLEKEINNVKFVGEKDNITVLGVTL